MRGTIGRRPKVDPKYKPAPYIPMYRSLHPGFLGAIQSGPDRYAIDFFSHKILVWVKKRNSSGFFIWANISQNSWGLQSAPYTCRMYSCVYHSNAISAILYRVCAFSTKGQRVKVGGGVRGALNAAGCPLIVAKCDGVKITP